MTEVQGTIELLPTERTLLSQLAGGMTTREIAGASFLSERTVKMRVRELCLRTHTSNRTHLVAFALRRGLIT